MNSKMNGNEESGSYKRIRIITGLAIEHTVGPPHGDNPEIQDGNQVLTEEDIAGVITSEQSLVLAKMMGDLLEAFRKRYPLAKVEGKLIPVHGVTGHLDMGGRE
jgi:hypothetical protein